MKFIILLALILPSALLAAPSQDAKVPNQNIELAKDKASESSKPLSTDPLKPVLIEQKPLSTDPSKPAVIEQNNKNNESSSSSKPDAKPTQTNQQSALPQIQIFPIPGQHAPSLSSPVQQLLIAVLRPTLAKNNNSQTENNEKNPNNFYPGPNEMGPFYPPSMFNPPQGMMGHPEQELPPFFGLEPPFPFGPEPEFHQVPHTEETHEIVEITLPHSHPPPYQPSHPFDGPHPSSAPGSSQAPGQFNPPGPYQGPSPFYPPGPYQGPGQFNQPGPYQGSGQFNPPGPYQRPGQFNPPGPYQGPSPFYPPGPYQWPSQGQGQFYPKAPYQGPEQFHPIQLDPSSILYLPALVAPQQSAFGPQSFQTQQSGSPTLVYFPATIANNQLPLVGAAPSPLNPHASMVG